MNSERDDTHTSDESLAKQFHAWRMSAGLTVEEIAHGASFSPVIVQAFEDGAYGVFSAHVYAQGYLKRIIDRFCILNGNEFMRALHNEWDGAHTRLRGEKELTHAQVLRNKRMNFYLTPRRIFGTLGLIALGFFFWFLAVQLAGLTAAPGLYVYEPAGDMAVGTPVIEVRGKTNKESQLTVNGREITMDGFGNFSQEIELIPGVNTLHFLVKNRFGNVSAVTRHIVVE